MKIIVDEQILKLASGYLFEHATLLEKQELLASADIVRTVAVTLAQQIELQQPQTLEQQIDVLSKAFGCGPDPDFNKP